MVNKTNKINKTDNKKKERKYICTNKYKNGVTINQGMGSEIGLKLVETLKKHL